MIPPVASNFVAGESVDGVLAHVAELNRDGIRGIVNLLGEHYSTQPPASEDADEYKTLITEINQRGLDACVSVKPSQIGLDISPGVFEDNLREIVSLASEHNVFVWVDMEDHTTTDTTLDVFESLVTEFGGMGLCIQANLKRTEEDLKRLAPLPGKIRLVKGAYDEPASIAYKDKATVNKVYRQYLEYMFEHFEDGVAVGSHDPEMIDYAIELHEKYGTPFEVQLLMGVREAAQKELAAEGIEVWQYIPYGDKWFSYFYRRVRERKENAFFALRAIVGR